MARTYTTMRGQPIDMALLAASNAEKRAIGNTSMNARGDLLGPGGIVLRTQEQVEQEWQRNLQHQQDLVTNNLANIKAPLFADRPGALAADQNFEPESAAEKTNYPSTEPHGNAEQVKKIVQQRRKIVESDK